MFYSQQELVRLLDEVERQGGEHLDEAHENIIHGKLSGDKARGYEATYCGESMLFVLPYKSFVGEEQQSVTVCANDDLMGLWPRFRNADAPGKVQ